MKFTSASGRLRLNGDVPGEGMAIEVAVKPDEWLALSEMRITARLLARILDQVADEYDYSGVSISGEIRILVKEDENTPR